MLAPRPAQAQCGAPLPDVAARGSVGSAASARVPARRLAALLHHPHVHLGTSPPRHLQLSLSRPPWPLGSPTGPGIWNGT